MSSIIVYLLLGIIIDAAIASYYRAISSRRVWLVSILGFAITAMTVFVLEGVIVSRSIYPLLAYSVGCGIGSGIGVAGGKK